ncbi:zona pellucida sperm-binding protein 3 [Anolis carolinensis]|uniref:zona pellucida sperm-binding protein 3 n=1 Tax=Anolis carolinensis TaxID=28377 RepID=UPI002F2B6C27
MFHAAIHLVWSGSANATQVAAPKAPAVAAATTTTPSPTQAHVCATRVKMGPELNFSLQLLNEDLSVSVEPGAYLQGEAIRIQASLQAEAGFFPKLFIDRCYVLDNPQQSQSRALFFIVDNHGCLYPGNLKAAWFRQEDPAVVLTMQTRAFWLDDKTPEIHVHCLLAAWSQKSPASPGKKTCSYNVTSALWKNVDEPSRPSVCLCCHGVCPSEPGPLDHPQGFVGKGQLHWVALGPLRLRKEGLPWLEGHGQTVKKLLVVSAVFVGSCVLGTLVALGLALFHHLRHSRKYWLLSGDRAEHMELQTLAGALAIREEIEQESPLN